MELIKKIPITDKSQENNHLLRMLDRGIDDMEAGRELPLEDAFRKITELRDARRNAKFKSAQYCFSQNPNYVQRISKVTSER